MYRKTFEMLIGFVFGIATILFSVYLNEPIASAVNAIGTSIVIASVVTLWQIYSTRIAEHRKNKFFGEEIMRTKTILVYPDFVLSEEAKKQLKNIHCQSHYVRPKSRFNKLKDHRNDLPRVVAANDVRALLYVAPLVSGWNGSGSHMEIDRSLLKNTDRSFLSFGLSSNDCTHLYSVTDDKPLFQICPDDEGSEYIKVAGQSYHSCETKQYGFIVRFRPKPYTHPHIVWFLIAGLGPIGTTAAAYYLAQNWQSLYNTVRSDEDFIAIIECPPASEQNGKLIDVVTRNSLES